MFIVPLVGNRLLIPLLFWAVRGIPWVVEFGLLRVELVDWTLVRAAIRIGHLRLRGKKFHQAALNDLLATHEYSSQTSDLFLPLVCHTKIIIV
jgi:hypothetical protein